MRIMVLLVILGIASCCPSQVSGGDDYSRCDVAKLIALLGDAAPESRSIRCAVGNPAALESYIENMAEWDPWEVRWLSILDRIMADTAGTDTAARAESLSAKIKAGRVKVTLRRITAQRLLPLLEALEQSSVE